MGSGRFGLRKRVKHVIVGSFLTFWTAGMAYGVETVSPQLLCQCVNNPKTFNYESLFDPAVIQYPGAKEALTAAFSPLTARHGSCLKAVASPFKDIGPLKTVLLDFSDGRQGVTQIAWNPDSGKISSMFIKGTNVPSEKLLKVVVEKVAMSDGTKLETLVFSKPGDTQKRPVVLVRTPYLYLDGSFAFARHYGKAMYYVNRGYNFVLQAVRGTFGSEGEFHLFNPQEVGDAADTIGWVANQPFSDGNIAAVGTSYEGFTAEAASITRRPELKVVFAGGAPTSLGEDAFVLGPLLSLQVLDYLYYMQTGLSAPYQSPQYLAALANPARLLAEPDLRKYDEIIYGIKIPEWQAVADAYLDPSHELWKTREIRSRLHMGTVPVYRIAGLGGDGDMWDTVRNFMIADQDPLYRQRNHLILGTWPHAGSTPEDEDGKLMGPFIKKRFDSLLAHYLKGQETPFIQEPRVQVATDATDDQHFTGGDSFPLPGLNPKTFYLTAGGALTGDVNAQKGSSTFQYLPFKVNNDGNDPKQNLVFETQVSQEMNVAGLAKARIFVRIPPCAVDIVAIPFTKEGHEGQERPLSAMASRAEGKPGEVVELKMRIPPGLAKLKAGDTIGVKITGNLFPNYVRTPQSVTGSCAKALEDMNIEILHSQEYPSQITFSTK